MEAQYGTITTASHVKCRSWRDGRVIVQVGHALLGFLTSCSTEAALEWLSLSEQQVLVWLGKETSIFWKVPFPLFCGLCVALPAGAVLTQKFFLFFFCLNIARIKVDSKKTNLQNCQIHMKLTTWQTTGSSCTYRRSHGMLLEARLLILTVLAKIQCALLFSASFKLSSALSITCGSFLHLLA